MSGNDTRASLRDRGRVRRRAVLATAGSAAALGLAGCIGDGDGDGDDGSSDGDSGSGSGSGGSTTTGNTADGAPDAFRLGATGPLTGALSGVAESVVVSYRVVEDWVNAEGGVYLEQHDTRVPLNFTLHDDESNPQRAVSLYRQLIEQNNVHMTLGPLTSQITSPVAPVIEENEVPLISGGSGTPDIFAETAATWGFSVITPAPVTARALVEVMDMLNSDAHVGEIRENEEVRNLISDAAKSAADEKGIQFETITTVPQETNDFSSAIAQAQSSGVDWLFANLHADNAALCLEQASQVGGWDMLSTHKLGNSSLQDQVGFENLENATGFTAWNRNVDYPNVEQYVEDYRAKFEERNGQPSTPDFHAAYGAIAMQAALQTFQNSDGYTSQDFLDVLTSREYVDTVSGDFSFDDRGIVTPSIAFGTQLKGSADSPELQILWPEDASNTEPVYPMN